jgi:hypothetical protein
VWEKQATQPNERRTPRIDPRRCVVITCDGEVDEGATELAREGLRPKT